MQIKVKWKHEGVGIETYESKGDWQTSGTEVRDRYIHVKVDSYSLFISMQDLISLETWQE